MRPKSLPIPAAPTATPLIKGVIVYFGYKLSCHLTLLPLACVALPVWQRRWRPYISLYSRCLSWLGVSTGSWRKPEENAGPQGYEVNGRGSSPPQNCLRLKFRNDCLLCKENLGNPVQKINKLLIRNFRMRHLQSSFQLSLNDESFANSRILPTISAMGASCSAISNTEGPAPLSATPRTPSSPVIGNSSAAADTPPSVGLMEPGRASHIAADLPALARRPRPTMRCFGRLATASARG